MEININDYNDMTPYELSIAASVFNEKQKALSDEKITLTYLGAYWQRVKKMPNLKQILGNEPVKKKMTHEEMFEKVKMLNAAFGGEVK